MSKSNVIVEDERLVEWRTARAKVAEAERDERIRKRDEARMKVEAEKRRLQRDTARALLPQEDALLVAHRKLRRQRFRRAVSFWTQFSVCVLAPVAATIWYLMVIATPLFEARAVIAITKPDDGIANQGANILGQLTGQSDLQEVFMAHEYVHSQALMDRLQSGGLMMQCLTSGFQLPASPSMSVKRNCAMRAPN